MDVSDPKLLIAAAYNAAADHAANAMLAHRNYFGERTVERARLNAGEYVLDVCCGAGGSSIPAARAVGAGGRVIGVDMAQIALDRARERAAGEGLRNVEFRLADFDQVYFRADSFDAVICVFGIFFFPNMAGALRKMWRYLRDGGRLAVTTRGPEPFEPGDSLFWQAVREVRPELYRAFAPWEKLTTPERVRALFAEAGISAVEIEDEDHPHLLSSAEDWWTVVMGTGYRGTVDRLTDAEREHVRQRCLTLAEWRLRSPVLYAVAEKRCRT
jgi:ubiquinone/menaquinone biosynthesis C-methylase UbiE